jgi:hypothetical protein
MSLGYKRNPCKTLKIKNQKFSQDRGEFPIKFRGIPGIPLDSIGISGGPSDEESEDSERGHWL